MLHERRFRERPCCRPIVSRSVTLPTVAMAAAAAAVPTFSWTYKAGQRQRPLLLGPEDFSRRGHLDGAAPSPPQRFEDFTSVSFKTLGGQGHRRGHGGWVDLSVHVRTRLALMFRGKRQREMTVIPPVACIRIKKTPLCKT